MISELLDEDADYNKPTDIFAIGFQEIVDLNASNIVSARYVLILPPAGWCLTCINDTTSRVVSYKYK